MCSTSSQELAAFPSDLNEPGCEQSRSVKSSRSRALSSPNAGQAFPATTTCGVLQLPDLRQMELPSMSYVAVSPAKTSASQERAPELEESVAVYGPNTLDLLASYDPVTSSWRTSQRCLVEGWTKFSETWPRSGLMRSGIAYQRPTLVPDNFGTEFGLWPTPNATEFKGGRTSPRRGVANPERNNWQDWCSLVLGQRYPVPETAEQVMGFPTGHTAIEQSATPSSRKSRKSSVARSSKRKGESK